MAKRSAVEIGHACDSPEVANIRHVSDLAETRRVSDIAELEDITAFISTLSGGLTVVLPDSDEDLAAEVAASIVRDATRFAETALKLTALKLRAGHGNWLPLLEKRGIKERTAQRYLGLATFLQALPASVRPKYLTAPVIKAGMLSQLTGEDIAARAENGSLDELLAMPKDEIAALLRKERTARQTAELKREKAEADLNKAQDLAANRAARLQLPQFMVVARGEAAALTETMDVALDGLTAVLKDLQAPHEDVIEGDRFAAQAAGTFYHALRAVWARTQALLQEVEGTFDDSVTGYARFEHQLKPGEVQAFLQTRKQVVGLAEVKAQNREAIRENAKGGRGRNRKILPEA